MEVEQLDLGTIPQPPADTVFIRAIDVHTVVDGEIEAIDYGQSVELSFILEAEDLEIAEGDTSRIGVLWQNPDTAAWEAMPTIKPLELILE